MRRKNAWAGTGNINRFQPTLPMKKIAIDELKRVMLVSL